MQAENAVHHGDMESAKRLRQWSGVLNVIAIVVVAISLLIIIIAITSAVLSPH